MECSLIITHSLTFIDEIEQVQYVNSITVIFLKLVRMVYSEHKILDQYNEILKTYPIGTFLLYR